MKRQLSVNLPETFVNCAAENDHVVRYGCFDTNSNPILPMSRCSVQRNSWSNFLTLSDLPLNYTNFYQCISMAPAGFTNMFRNSVTGSSFSAQLSCMSRVTSHCTAVLSPKPFAIRLRLHQKIFCHHIQNPKFAPQLACSTSTTLPCFFCAKALWLKFSKPKDDHIFHVQRCRSLI